MEEPTLEAWEDRRLSSRSDEFRQLGRRVAELALIRVSQGGRLNVRHREQLRRALIDVGTALLWGEMAAGLEEPIDALADDLSRVTKSGVRVIEREVADELKAKKTELKKLDKFVEELRELQEKDADAFPLEVSYAHTARAAAVGLVTKVETVTLEGPDDAKSTADSIEKSRRRWENHRDQMVEELKKRQTLIGTVRSELAEFVRVQRPMLKEVLALLG